MSVESDGLLEKRYSPEQLAHDNAKIIFELLEENDRLKKRVEELEEEKSKIELKVLNEIYQDILMGVRSSPAHSDYSSAISHALKAVINYVDKLD